MPIGLFLIVGGVSLIVLGLEPLLLWATISLLYAPLSFWGIYFAWLFTVFLAIICWSGVQAHLYLMQDDIPKQPGRPIQRIR